MAATFQPAGYGWGGPPPDPTNVVGRRIGAFFIDAGLAIVLALVLVVSLAQTTNVRGALRDHDCEVKLDDRGDPVLSCRGFVTVNGDEVRILDAGPVTGIAIGSGLIFYLVVPALAGASLGKLMVGLRVVDANGKKAGFFRTLGRWVFFAVDGPLSIGICGLATFLASRGHRRVGDMVAGTFVVEKAAVGYPVVIPSVGPPPGGYPAPGGYPTPPTGGYPPAGYYPPPPVQPQPYPGAQPVQPPPQPAPADLPGFGPPTGPSPFAPPPPAAPPPPPPAAPSEDAPDAPGWAAPPPPPPPPPSEG